MSASLSRWPDVSANVKQVRKVRNGNPPAFQRDARHQPFAVITKVDALPFAVSLGIGLGSRRRSTIGPIGSEGEGTMRRLAMLAGFMAAAAPAAAQTPPPQVPPLSDYFQPVTAAPAAPDADGFLRRWLILEPVAKPNRTNAVFTGTYVRDALRPATYPGRWAALPREGQTVRAGEQTLRWHAYDSRLWDAKLFNLAQALGKPTYGVIFWVATVVNSPREMRDVRLAVGSNSASRWWLNGANVADLYDDRRMVMDDVLSDRITLKKGRNVLRGAIINGPGLSDFAVRFVDTGGQPVRDLTVTVQ